MYIVILVIIFNFFVHQRTFDGRRFHLHTFGIWGMTAGIVSHRSLTSLFQLVKLVEKMIAGMAPYRPANEKSC